VDTRPGVPSVRDRLGLSADTLELLERLEERYAEAVAFGFLGPREAERLRERHLDDALGLALHRRPKPGTRWADLGSGAGLPGLPLAAAFPETSFTLVDSHKRRLTWVASTAEALGITNVAVVHERLEAFGRSPDRERFDVAVARALGQPPVVLELGLPLIRKGGLLMVPRGQVSDGERALLTRVAKQLGGGAPKVVHNAASPVDRPGAVIMMTKVATTSRRFPRQPGQPERQPLS
jgi:16S rRNA (guanine527-N7)-methyltransferase